jgi:hypothetical protein
MDSNEGLLRAARDAYLAAKERVRLLNQQRTAAWEKTK